MNANVPFARRAFLRLTAAVAGGAILSACGAAASAPSPSASSSAAPGSAPGSAAPAASAAASAKPVASALPRKLIMASTSAAGSQTPLWLADNLKAWSDRGLEVDRKRVSTEIGTKALISKDIDVLIQSPAAVVAADINANADLVYVGSIFNFSQFALAVKSSIQSAADLKGKAIGNDVPGSTTDFQTQVMLKKLGLKPSDVQLPNMGASDGIIAALLAGKIEAGTISVPQIFQAQAAGFRLLSDTFDIKYQNIGPVVSKARLDELMPYLLPLLLGIRDGIRAVPAQPELTKKLIADNTKESNPDILQKTYDFYTKTTHFQEDLELTIEGFQSIIDFSAETTLPGAKGAKADRFIDRRVLDRLPKS